MTTLTSTERDQIKEDLATRVAEWTQGLCDSLTQNYRDYHVDMLERNSERYDGSMSQYAKDQLAAIEDGSAKLMYFKINAGRKFYKIVQMEFDTFQDRNEYRERSVTAFVDKKTGEVYKPASWKAPAKHVRYDMRIITHRQACHNPKVTGWAGGFLYMR